METNIFVDISPPTPHLGKFWFLSYVPKCWKPIKLQDSEKCNISKKKWMTKFIVKKHWSLLQGNTIIFGVGNQACPKYPKQKVCMSLQYLQKSMGDEVDFLSADKHESFLQIDSITLGVHSQACPKYPRQQVHNNFAVSQGKCGGWSWFFIFR